MRKSAKGIIKQDFLMKCKAKRCFYCITFLLQAGFRLRLFVKLKVKVHRQRVKQFLHNAGRDLFNVTL